MAQISTVADIEEFQWQLRNSDPFSVPPLRGTCLSLAAALELSYVLSQHDTVDLRSVLARQFSTCPRWRMLQKLLKQPRVSEGSVVFARIPPDYDQRWYVEEMRNFRSALLSNRFPVKLSASLTGGVFEMVDNVWRHSGSRSYSVFAYQVRTRTFSFCVGDSGVGVLASLRRNQNYAHLRTSLEALEEAVKPNVSGLKNGSGLGFDKLVRALADLWGQTRLRSGQGVLLFNRETERPTSRRYFLPDLRGFLVSGICRLSPPSEAAKKRVDRSMLTHYDE